MSHYTIFRPLERYEDEGLLHYLRSTVFRYPVSISTLDLVSRARTLTELKLLLHAKSMNSTVVLELIKKYCIINNLKFNLLYCELFSKIVIDNFYRSLSRIEVKQLGEKFTQVSGLLNIRKDLLPESISSYIASSGEPLSVYEEFNNISTRLLVGCWEKVF